MHGSKKLSDSARKKVQEEIARTQADDLLRVAGRLIGEGCHFIDFLQFLCAAKPVRVHARGLGGGGPRRLSPHLRRKGCPARQNGGETHGVVVANLGVD